LQFGHPNSLLLSRISPFSYASLGKCQLTSILQYLILIGVILVLLAAIPGSLLFKQRLNADEKWQVYKINEYFLTKITGFPLLAPGKA